MLCVCSGPSVFLMNYPSEEKDIPLKADSDPARYNVHSTMYRIYFTHKT